MKSVRDIELWALSVLARVSRGIGNEDSLVELKRELVDPRKLARQIAGHANSAGGADIMWLFGVDELEGLQKKPIPDLADWMPSVLKCFHGVAPNFKELLVSFDGGDCLAILFDTSRAPYLVTNPQFGIEKTAINSEVPWREGARTVTASRENLMRLLAPRLKMPDFEVLESRISARRIEKGDHCGEVFIDLELSLYVMLREECEIVIPRHRISTVAATGVTELCVSRELDLYNVGISGALGFITRRDNPVVNIPCDERSLAFSSNKSEFVFRRSCKVDGRMNFRSSDPEVEPPFPVVVDVEMLVGFEKTPIRLSFSGECSLKDG